MRNILLWTALLCCLLGVTPALAEVDGTISPIIGIVTQETRYDQLISAHYNTTSYIAASYVKFVEGAGGRVVPIRIGYNRSYYEQLLKKINGVLFPGGAVYFNNSKGYGDAGELIINIAKEINDNGTFFPVWGTCLGMELLVLKTANNTETRFNCKSKNQALPLEFKEDYKESRMFAGLPGKLSSVLEKENVTYNYHGYCYTEQSFLEPPLNGSWRIMSLNHDKEGVEFVSSIEHLKYPFYGVQFHPEKPLYEFGSSHVPHTKSSIRIGQYFADFFVNEARRNPHNFTTTSEQSRALIYNYSPEYTSKIGSNYEQQYLFDADPDIDDDGDNVPYVPMPFPQDNSADARSARFGVVLATFLAFLLFRFL